MIHDKRFAPPRWTESATTPSSARIALRHWELGEAPLAAGAGTRATITIPGTTGSAASAPRSSWRRERAIASGFTEDGAMMNIERIAFAGRTYALAVHLYA
jgi:hypothetical protein